MYFQCIPLKYIGHITQGYKVLMEFVKIHFRIYMHYCDSDTPSPLTNFEKTESLSRYVHRTHSNGS